MVIFLKRQALHTLRSRLARACLAASPREASTCRQCSLVVASDGVPGFERRLLPWPRDPGRVLRSSFTSVPPSVKWEPRLLLFRQPHKRHKPVSSCSAPCRERRRAPNKPASGCGPAGGQCWPTVAASAEAMGHVSQQSWGRCVQGAANSPGAAQPTPLQPCGPPAGSAWASGSWWPGQGRLSLSPVPRGKSITGDGAVRRPHLPAFPLNSESNSTCACGCQASVSDVLSGFCNVTSRRGWGDALLM